MEPYINYIWMFFAYTNLGWWLAIIIGILGFLQIIAFYFIAQEEGLYTYITRPDGALLFLLACISLAILIPPIYRLVYYEDRKLNASASWHRMIEGLSVYTNEKFKLSRLEVMVDNEYSISIDQEIPKVSDFMIAKHQLINSKHSAYPPESVAKNIWIRATSNRGNFYVTYLNFQQNDYIQMTEK